jgi:DNA-directed RNA polymerase specialized sigma24 family protein
MSRTRTAGLGTADLPGRDVVVALEREWPALAPSLLDALRAWRLREPVLAAFSTPQLLVRFLQRFDADLDAKDAALAALLRCAQTDARAGRVILQALLPGLKRLAERLIRDPGTRDEVWSTLLAAAWERIYSYPLVRRPQRIAANLLLDTRLAIRQERERARRGAARELALADVPPPPRSLPFPPEQPLRRAVDAGAITAEEAELIAQTRIDGTPLVELAAEIRVAYDALRKRRERAERRLLLFLGQPDVRFEGRNRRSFSARIAGPGLAGSAGGGAVTDPKQRR